MATNGHFAGSDSASQEKFDHGVQVIDEAKEFTPNLHTYLEKTDVIDAGFNYHLISVFGSQSTGKSTLLNSLFGTEFSVMSETQRQQTTKGIWMSKNKKGLSGAHRIADNILVMDVEGTDGRERGEDQDFERKSALFALATSEVLIVNVWEHQVGLYQGANMGLLKTVFEVNLQLFLKDKSSTPRSLLFFVIRDHIGNTPLANLRNTLLQDLAKIWSSISKPQGHENSRIDDYFDFAFAALPHKILLPEKFLSEIDNLRQRFVAGSKATKENQLEGGVFLPEYHRRIPADGFSVYAEGVWDQIVHNKDLDLPTQQELLAQFRCDEIAREVLVAFDTHVTPLEDKHAASVRSGKPALLPDLGSIGRKSREAAVKAFQTQASRYHKGVYSRKQSELETKIDQRLKSLYLEQLSAAKKIGLAQFSDAVSSAVKAGQKAGGAYEFAEIVEKQKHAALETFSKEVSSLEIPGVAWTNFQPQASVFESELDEASAKLRKEEMRRLAVRIERWVRSRLSEDVSVEFNKLGSGRAGMGAPETLQKPPLEKELWDRVWAVFVDVVKDAEARFTERAKSFKASEAEMDVGLWRLRRKSWVALREKIDEEVMEGNLLLKLRENFEDKFRYDEAGVPRIWRPTDDIESIYTRARESTLQLVPLLAHFKLSRTHNFPELVEWVGSEPVVGSSSAGDYGSSGADDAEVRPIGGVDDGGDAKSLEEEMTILSEAKRLDLVVRFKKTADGVYVEAKRSAIGGIAQVPLYFYGILLALGWNEILTVLRNPVLFLFLLVTSAAVYAAYFFNMLGPIMQMSSAAYQQGVQISRQKLREFVESNDTARAALAMPAIQQHRDKFLDGGSSSNRGNKNATSISLDTLDSHGKKKTNTMQSQSYNTGSSVGSGAKGPVGLRTPFDDDDE